MENSDYGTRFWHAGIEALAVGIQAQFHGIPNTVSGDGSPLTAHRKILTKKFYQDCQSLKLKAPFKDQFDRALLSVILNLAEGSAKPTAKDRKRFYAIAMGSLREVQVILDLNNFTTHLKSSDAIAACLYKLTLNPGGRG